MTSTVGFVLSARCWLNGCRAALICPHVGHNLVVGGRQFRSRQRMGFEPEGARGGKWVRSGGLPPRCFIAAPVNRTVVRAAERHRELVAHLASKCTGLREAEMMWIRRPPTANYARLFHHMSDVVTIAKPPRLGEWQHTLIDL